MTILSMCLRRSKIRLVYAGGNIERATRECCKRKKKRKETASRESYTHFFRYIYIVFYFIEPLIALSLREMMFLIEFSQKIPSRANIEHDLPSVFFFFLILHSRRGRLRRDYDLPSYFFIGGRVSSRGKTMYVCARSTINERVRARSLVFLTYIITRIISP